MASLVEINTLLDASVVAIGNADWVLAETKLMQAAVFLAGRPDNQKDGLQLRYDRSAVQRMLDQVKKKISANPDIGGGGGLGQTKVTYRRATN